MASDEQASRGKAPGAEPFVPSTKSLLTLSAAAQACRGCELYKRATQAVVGAGPKSARVVIVGEQPGDQEDLKGEPFVGPAGTLLDKALSEAGLSRGQVYLTNAVKHFSWEPRGKRRIHKKPRLSEIKACHPWLDAEIRIVSPSIIVCLGATAAQSVLGSSFQLMRERGRVMTIGQGLALATIHPSAVLRSRDDAARRAAFEMLVNDLKVARAAI
jgi:DNA polymerase